MGDKRAAVLVANQYVRYNGIMYSKGMEILAIADRAADRFVRKGQAHWEYRAGGEGTFLTPPVTGTIDKGVGV